MKKLLLLPLLLCMLNNASADNKPNPFEQLVILGDSFSDNGNTYTASGYTYPGGAYSLGRFSNGPTWSEYLAMQLGIDPMNVSVFRNYAYGEAQIEGIATLNTHQPGNAQTAWSFTVPDLKGEIDQYSKEGNVKPQTTLYFIFMGANDLLGFTPKSPAENKQFVEKKLTALNEQITRLKNLGANRIILMNMRDMTPSTLVHQQAARYVTKHPGFSVDKYIATVDQMLKHFNSSIEKIYQYDKSVRIYDAYSFDQKLLAAATQPQGKLYQWYRDRFSITHGKNAQCYANEGNYVDVMGKSCANPQSYFFYDRIHPTTAVHYLMSRDVYEFINSR